MLQLNNITRRYNDKVAVSGVDLEIEPGTFVGIIGRSGAGKSTLLRMINRLVEPSEGTIHWDGRDVTGLKGSGLRDWRAQCASMNGDEFMLQLNNITRRYNDKVAVSGVDLEIEPGTFVGIIGRSGAGKSTLLRMINRLVEPSEGTIHWDGRDVTGLKGSGLRDWRAQCAMIFQHFNLVDRLDVLTNVLMGRLNYVSTPKSLLRIWSDEERLIALSALQQFDIAHLAAHRADELSGGQQQRVAIARALVQQPRIILADEPIASLDPRNTRSVMDALRRINREYGITVLCNLHSLDIARSYCDRLVGMSAGKIVFRGTPSMLTDMASRDLYGMEAADVIDADEQAETMPMPAPQSAEAVLRQLSA